MIRLHRQEQWDLGSITPLVAAHWEVSGRSARVFCLSTHGIQVGNWRWYWRQLPRDPFLVAQDRDVAAAIDRVIAETQDSR